MLRFNFERITRNVIWKNEINEKNGKELVRVDKC